MLPPDVERRRERAVQALSGRGDAVGVLRLVTAWNAEAPPTLAARVAAGRALLDLKQVDRALARAREAVEAAPSDRGALRLLAEAYLERGWPLRARSVLETLRAAGDDVADLMLRSTQEPPRPETTAGAVEAAGDFSARLALAEQFLAAGALARAGVLLTRLGNEEPKNGRVLGLRWALAGDYRGSEPIELQVKRALPAILELDSLPDDSEHTERIGDTGDVLLEPMAGEAPFPSLFKVPAEAPTPIPPAAAGEDDERTAHSEVPAPAPLQSVTGGGPGDTQILMVVGEADHGPLHRKREGPDRVLNLRDWQASMGVDPVPSDLDDVEQSESWRSQAGTPLVESASPPPPPEPRTDTYQPPIRVIEKHPIPVRPPNRRRPPETAAPPARGLLLRVLLGAALLVGMGLVLVLLGLLIARAGGLLDAARVRVDVGRVLASADYPALVEAETRLAARATGPVELTELARLRMVIWAEFRGDHALQEQVDALLAEPRGIDPNRLAYLRAAELLAFRNPASALAAIGREPPADDEARLLLARIHAQLGDADAALGDLAGLVAPEEPRYRLGRAQVLLALGQRAEARAIITLFLSVAPNHVQARLLELQLREGTPAERAAAADVFRKTYGALGLSPRQVGEAAWVEAQAWLDGGHRDRALRAAAQGIARDGTNADLLMLLASEDVVQSDFLLAARKLQTLSEIYRADPAVQQALVLVLLELDRIVEAHAVARLANPPLREDLVALVYGWSGQAGAPDVTSVQGNTPIGAWASALLAVNARRDDAAAFADLAVAALEASNDPGLRRLAPRARVLAATQRSEPLAGTELATLRRSGLGDAAAHVYLGRYLERVGQRLSAAQHFDRAADLEPELGLALYERGRFYADARAGDQRSAAAWGGYLELAPTGPRADRARGLPSPTPD
ncbi:MAG: hypothetical protein EXR72_15255 [Myxococcales bacterium]|nr:hypothetical protein [Myxococcales bacterium]